MSLPNSLQSSKDLPDKSWLHEIDLYECVVSFQISSDFKPHSNALPCLHRPHLACIHGRLVMSLHAVAAEVGAVKGGDGAHHMGHPEPGRRVDIQEALNALPPHEGTCQTSPRQLVKPCSIDGFSTIDVGRFVWVQMAERDLPVRLVWPHQVLLLMPRPEARGGGEGMYGRWRLGSGWAGGGSEGNTGGNGQVGA